MPSLRPRSHPHQFPPCRPAQAIRQPALDDAERKHGFPKGRSVGGLRKRTGAEVNEWWDSRPTEKIDRSAAHAARWRKPDHPEAA
jgi:hypothetical protein